MPIAHFNFGCLLFSVLERFKTDTFRLYQGAWHIFDDWYVPWFFQSVKLAL